MVLFSLCVTINGDELTRWWFCKDCQGCLCQGPVLYVFNPARLNDTTEVTFPHKDYFDTLSIDGAMDTSYHKAGICTDSDMVPDNITCESVIKSAVMYNHIKHLEITNNPYLVYLSSNIFDLFPALETLNVTRNQNLEGMPSPDANGINSLAYENNSNARTVSFTKTFQFTNLMNFIYISNEKTKSDLSIEKINTGRGCKYYKISTSANTVTVQLPICENIDIFTQSTNVTIVLPKFNTSEKVEVFSVTYCPEVPGNLTILRTEVNEKLHQISFTLCLPAGINALTYIPQELRNIIYEKQPNFTLAVQYPTQQKKLYTLKYVNLLTHTPSGNIIENSLSNYYGLSNLTEEFPPEIEFDGDIIIINYVAVEIKNLLDKISEIAYKIKDAAHEKKYIVNTYMLLSNGNVIYLIDNITINYRVLFPLAHPTLYYFRYNKGEVKFSIKPWNVKLVYKVLYAALMLTIPWASETKEQKTVKNFLFENLVNSFDQNDFNKLSNIVPIGQRYVLPDILAKRVQIYSFFKRQTTVVRNIPRGSRSLYKEKTILYQEIAKNIITGKRFYKLFQVSKFKSQVQQYLTNQELKSLYEENLSLRSSLVNVTQSRKDCEKEVKHKTETFQAAVEKRQSQAVSEAIFSVLDAVTNIFGSGYNSLNAISRIHKKFKGIRNTLNGIRSIITKLNALDKKVMKKWKTRAHRFKSTASGVTKIVEAGQLVNVVEEGFDPDVDGIKETLGDIDDADILKWNTAKSDITTMMDAALTVEIPETYSLKKSILRMIEAGKTETQLKLEMIRVNASIVLKDYERERYRQEETIANDIIKSQREEKEGNDLQESYQLSIEQFKLDMFLHVIDFCDVSFYHTLQSCYSYKLFRYETNLEEMIFLTNKMLAEDVDNVNDLFPQTFNNEKITFSWDVNCNRIIEKYKRSVDLNEEEVDLYGKCISSNIYQLKEKQSFKFNIPLYHSKFKFFDRVRIEDIRIMFKGVQTSNKMLEVILESGNIRKDKLQGKVFIFNSEKWQRVYRGYIDTANASICQIPFNIAADVHKEFYHQVNLPTPFTDWTITLPLEHNPDLNLTDLASVIIQFSGNALDSNFVSKEPEQTEYKNIFTEIMEEVKHSQKKTAANLFIKRDFHIVKNTHSKHRNSGKMKRNSLEKIKDDKIKLNKVTLKSIVKQQIAERQPEFPGPPNFNNARILSLIPDATTISEEKYRMASTMADIIPAKIKNLPSSSRDIALDYVVVDLSKALQEFSEIANQNNSNRAGTNKIINTCILLCKGNNIHDIQNLKINYRYTYILGDPTISSLEALKFNMRNITVMSLYDILFAITMLKKPSMPYYNLQYQDFPLNKLLSFLKEIDYQDLKKETPTQKHHFIDNLIIKTQTIMVYMKKQSQNAITIPITSNRLFKEKLKALQEIGKSLISQDGFQNLLKVSKVKSQTQKQISVKEQEQLFTKLQNVEKILNYSKQQREFYQNEAILNKETFQSAVRRRQAEAVAEAVFAVFDVATNLLSGSFNIIGAIKNLAKDFKNLKEAFTKISELLKKLHAFDKVIKPMWTNHVGKFKKVWEGSVKVIQAEKAVNAVKHGFDPGVQGMINKIGDIDAADMLNWDIAKTDIETMMDSALTNEIPETYAYKKSLMRMIEAGKAETEGMLVKAKLQAEVTLKEFEVNQYQAEVAMIESATPELWNQEGANMVEDIRQISMMQFKIDMFLNSVEFCYSSIYHTLKKCLIYDQYRYDMTPGDIIEITNRMLKNHLENAADIYPSPQTFQNLEVKFTWDKNCYNFTKADTLEDADVENIKAYQKCLSSKIYELVQNNMIRFHVSLSDGAFRRFNRIRVEEIKVFIKGIKTKRNTAHVNIETSTIFQDRFRAENFTFHANSWKRSFQYNINPSSCEDYVVLRGNIQEDFSENVNLPSIFTTWTISLPEEKNEGLDLSNVTAIDILFSGSLVVSDYHFSKKSGRKIDMKFLETGEIESSKDNEKKVNNEDREVVSRSIRTGQIHNARKNSIKKKPSSKQNTANNRSEKSAQQD